MIEGVYLLICIIMLRENMKASFEKITGFFKRKYHALSYWLAREDGTVAWIYYHIWHRGLSGVGKYYVFFTVAIVVYLLWAGGHSVFTGSIDLVGALFEKEKNESPLILEKGDYENYRNLMLGLAGLAALPFFLIRMWVEERKTKTAEQGHMTDRINKAVEALGEEKTSKKIDEETREVREFTEPNLEVRIGAILALERISQDSQRDHWPVMEILTAYLKNNTSLEKNPLPDEVRNKIKSGEEIDLDKIPAPRSDIQLIMTVLGRRSWGARVISYHKKQRLDLTELNLCRVDLKSCNLQYANFSESYAIHADFKYGNFQHAILMGISLQHSYLLEASFQYANLIEANLQYASPVCINFQNADLSTTGLQNANLNWANLRHCILYDADLQNANLSVLNLEDFNEESLEELQKMLNLTYGNTETTIPENMKRPEHWLLSLKEQAKILTQN